MKFSRYVEIGKYVEDIDFGDFIKCKLWIVFWLLNVYNILIYIDNLCLLVYFNCFLRCILYVLLCVYSVYKL